MTHPIRIQRRRAKGFALQAVSRSANGRACAIVDRSSKFGNPYQKRDYAQPSNQPLVDLFKDFLKSGEPEAAWILENLHTLRNKNLACWCPLDHPCHADVLLEMANG